MIILVSDTSILIDLERGDLLNAAFSCGLTMVVPDLLYEREIEQNNGAYLRALGLVVISLTSEEVELAQMLSTEHKRLSLPDCFALSCAKRENHALVTGDALLRKVAQAQQVEVFGLLWMLDRMRDLRPENAAELFDGLTRRTAHPRCRLPREQIQLRLEKWQ